MRRTKNGKASKLYWRDKCDVLYSQIIRSRGACQRCGERRYDLLETSHIHTRDIGSTRCELDNSLCLCSSCHRWWHDHPSLTRPFLLTIYSQEDLDDLDARAVPGAKIDWEERHAELKALAFVAGLS